MQNRLSFLDRPRLRCTVLVLNITCVYEQYPSWSLKHHLYRVKSEALFRKLTFLLFSNVLSLHIYAPLKILWQTMQFMIRRKCLIMLFVSYKRNYCNYIFSKFTGEAKNCLFLVNTNEKQWNSQIFNKIIYYIYNLKRLLLILENKEKCK